MKASELIALLTETIAAHGDWDVTIQDEFGAGEPIPAHGIEINYDAETFMIADETYLESVAEPVT